MLAWVASNPASIFLLFRNSPHNELAATIWNNASARAASIALWLFAAFWAFLAASTG